MKLKQLALAICCATGGHQATSQALEEMIVTAQQRDQNLQEVPIAVTAINADQLEQSGVTTLSDISQQVPGLTITDSQSEGIGISMRGINTNDFGFAVEQSIPVYLDGAYLGVGVPLLGDLEDVAQVEVLKGPQGTLFGRNALGGAVNVTTADVSEQFEGKVGVKVGNYDLRKISSVVNIPLIDDTLGMRISLGKLDRNGWQENIVTGKDDGYEQDRWQARAKISWTPTEGLQFVLTSDKKDEQDHVGYYNSLEAPFSEVPGLYSSATADSLGDKAANGSGSLASVLLGGPAVPEDVEPSYELKREIEGHALKANWYINDELTFTSITSYRTLDSDIEEDNDGTEYLMLNVRSFLESTELSQEFRINGELENVDWFVGLSAYQQETEGSVDDAFGSYLAGFPFRELNMVESTVDSYGLFGDVIWSLSDELNFTVGARYSYDEKTQDILTPVQNTFGSGINALFAHAGQLTDAQGNLDPSLADLEEDWDNFSMRAVVDYRFTYDVMAYLSVSQGYKSGGFNSFPLVSFDTFVASPGQLEPYDEETITSYELGLKSTYMDGRLRLNASYYYYDWEDLQVLIEDGIALFNLNAGEATGQGVDIEVAYQASDALMFTANMGWLDAEIGEDVAGSTLTEGEELNFSPSFSGNLSADYIVAMADDSEVRAHVDYSYTGEHFVAEGREVDSHELINARLSYLTAGQEWEVALWGRNLADEDRIDVVSDFSGSLGFTSTRRNEPRTYGVEVVYYF